MSIHAMILDRSRFILARRGPEFDIFEVLCLGDSSSAFRMAGLGPALVSRILYGLSSVLVMASGDKFEGMSIVKYVLMMGMLTKVLGDKSLYLLVNERE